MPRIARLIIPGIPHHVTQRGNRRQPTFFSEEDRQTYLRLLLEESRQYGVVFWAYCLMDNHVHFIAVPESSESLARAFGETHRRYSSRINRREGWTGYLWQGRFASFPMEPRHCYAAIRYVERNPVDAGLVALAEEYPWSSARAHAKKTPDPLLAPLPLTQEIEDWAAFLRLPTDEIKHDVERHSRTGRPLGSPGFVEQLERLTGRRLRKQPPGRRRRK